MYNVGEIHIGADKTGMFAKKAAKALIEYVNAAPPSDYEHITYYMDFQLKIHTVVRNGVATIDQEEIGDEEADAICDRWYGDDSAADEDEDA